MGFIKREKSSWILEKLYWWYQSVRVQRALSALWVLPSHPQSFPHLPTTQDPVSNPLAALHLPFPWAWLEWRDGLCLHPGEPLALTSLRESLAPMVPWNRGFSSGSWGPTSFLVIHQWGDGMGNGWLHTLASRQWRLTWTRVPSLDQKWYAETDLNSIQTCKSQIINYNETSLWVRTRRKSVSKTPCIQCRLGHQTRRWHNVGLYGVSLLQKAKLTGYFLFFFKIYFIVKETTLI